MHQIPIVTTRDDMADSLVSVLARMEPNVFTPIRIRTTSEAIDTLTFEMPVVALIDFSDPDLNAFELLSQIGGDLWMVQSAIVGICDSSEIMRKLESTSGTNVIVVIRPFDVPSRLPRIMHIFHENQRILYQRGLGTDLIRNLSGSFELRNDVLESVCYANLISSLLFSSNVISFEKKQKLQVALHELLQNAIEHGNCAISYAEKSAWLDAGKNIEELIAEKCKDPIIAARRVRFEYQIEPTLSRFTIVDEGEGFDWKGYVHSHPFNIEDAGHKLHGRGLSIARVLTENLSFNEKGNKVVFEIYYHRDEGELAPGMFRNVGHREVGMGEVIFSQGEPSNFLYYIASGTYDVMVDGRVVSELTPEDIFMGEMSFLLNNVRSATVRARSRGRLIGISKKQFIGALRECPHYSLFLSRLLAQRINRLNQGSVKQL